MDAVEREPAVGVRCDGCGYDRRGLPGGAACPECGEGPPAVVAAAGGEFLRTAGEVAWARSVAVGLGLLLVSSYYAVQVLVLMPVGSYSVSAVNFAGPKVQGVAMLERDLNGRPGPLGVSGTVMALVGVVGVWMATAGRTSGAGEPEPGGRTRAAARWTAVVVAGAVLGGTLDYAGGYLSGMSDTAGGGVLTVIVGCELPANLLLYLHLHRLAGRLGCRRAARPLAVCRWLVPTAIFLGAALQFAQVKWNDDAVGSSYYQPLTHHDWVWAGVSGGYGIVVLAATAAATAAVLDLTATAAAVGFGHWVGRMAGGAAAAASLARRAVAAVERDLPRWAAVAGLFGWVCLLPLHATTALSGTNRQGLLGSVPLVNFFGPVVAVPRMDADRGTYESAFDVGNGSLCVTGLAMVWLVTGLRVPGKDDVRLPARWWATMAVAVPVGILLGMTAREHPALFRSKEIAAAVTFGEVPATFLLYLHLAAVAAAAGQAAASRRLRVLAWVLPAVIELPLLGLVFSRSMAGHYQSWISTALAAGETAVALSLSFVAAATVLRLAWTLARPATDRG